MMPRATQVCRLLMALAVCGMAGHFAFAQGDASAEALRRGRAAIGAREAGIEALLQFLDDERVFEELPDEAAEAVEMLGRLGAEDAVPLLVEHITFRPRISWRESIRDYPCMVALMRIGLPAIPDLVKLAATDDELMAYGATGTLPAIYGNGGLAAFRLREAAEVEIDPERKARLLTQAEEARMSPPEIVPE